MSPKISVIIPAYNREKTISYSIRSVLNQTYKHFEIIVVDDKSSDRTSEIVRSFNDPCIKLVKLESRSGAQAARNRGILEARCEWIAFLDSDDEWVPEKIELQVEILERNKYNRLTVVHGNGWRFDYQTGEKTIIDVSAANGDQAYLNLLRGSAALFPAILTSKKALKKIGYLDELVPSYQEWDTSIRLSKICQFVHINKPLFIYHIHCEDTISKSIKNDILGVDYITKKFKNEIILNHSFLFYSNRIKSNIERALQHNYHELAGELIQKSNDLKINYLIYLYFLLWLKIKPSYIRFLKPNNLVKNLKNCLKYLKE